LTGFERLQRNPAHRLNFSHGTKFARKRSTRPAKSRSFPNRFCLAIASFGD
jgi:hypothetical protein